MYAARTYLRPACAALFIALAILLISAAAHPQSVQTTTVSGTVYRANGSTATGTLQISWPAFTTAAGQAVAAGRTTTPIAPNGAVSVNLAPNLGSTPGGLFYTVVYNLSDGSTSTEYWAMVTAAASPTSNAAWSATSKAGSAPRASLPPSACSSPSLKSPLKPGTATEKTGAPEPVLSEVEGSRFWRPG